MGPFALSLATGSHFRRTPTADIWTNARFRRYGPKGDVFNLMGRGRRLMHWESRVDA
jgi:hypothetical protein